VPACLNAHCEKKSRRYLARVTGLALSFDAGLNYVHIGLLDLVFQVDTYRPIATRMAIPI